MVIHKYYYKGGRWWLPPSPVCGESCEFVYAHDSFVHQKCSNYTLTNSIFGLCRSMWIINPIITHPNPHLKGLACPSTLEMLQVKEHTPIPYFVILTFGLVVEFIKEFKGVSWLTCSIYPSVWGWKVVDSFTFTHKNSKNCFQNLDANWGPQSKMTFSGIPW
jgi:hypothetical protein